LVRITTPRTSSLHYYDTNFWFGALGSLKALKTLRLLNGIRPILLVFKRYTPDARLRSADLAPHSRDEGIDFSHTDRIYVWDSADGEGALPRELVSAA
jgi:hypothetical protein